jgi:dihydrofolate reductase
MGKVVFDISMSLDGCMTAANRTPEEPMGAGGLRLTEWSFGEDEQNRAYLEAAISSAGAVICGRRTYDTSVPWWGADGPTGPVRHPVFVVTHAAPVSSSPNGVYTFVTDGIESALAQARDAAGNRIVTVMGGASIGQQYIAAGLVDELSIHLVPVLLGDGTRMFERIGERQLSLKPTETILTPAPFTSATDSRRTPQTKRAKARRSLHNVERYPAGEGGRGHRQQPVHDDWYDRSGWQRPRLAGVRQS